MKKITTLFLLCFTLTGCFSSDRVSNDDFTFESFEAKKVLDYVSGFTYVYKNVIEIEASCSYDISYVSVTIKTYDSEGEYLNSYSASLTQDIKANETFIITVSSQDSRFTKTSTISPTFSGTKMIEVN